MEPEIDLEIWWAEAIQPSIRDAEQNLKQSESVLWITKSLPSS